MKHSKKEMEELLAKYFSGNASSEEKDEVVEWRGASEENAKFFLEFKASWASTYVNDRPNQNVLSQIIGEDITQNETVIKVVPIWQQRPIQVAASVVVIIGLLFALLQPNYEDQPWGEVLSEKTVFKLPDGSSVTVHEGGSLTMGNFEDVRSVEMTGKAYFDVARDEEKPFLIQTKSSQVRVLGTSFVVNSNEENLVTEVLVESGLVAFGQNEKYFGKNTMEIQLKQGEMGILAVGEKGIKKKKIADENYLAWQNQVLTFRRTRLNNVVDVLEDVYGINVTFENPKMAGCYLTAKYNKKSADEVVKLIAETFNMTYEIKGNMVVFDGNGCR
tara:strand:- start:341 stop:1333 length:993 start_codon:yes stop_codon:yes gene_type:complete